MTADGPVRIKAIVPAHVIIYRHNRRLPVLRPKDAADCVTLRPRSPCQCGRHVLEWES